MTYKRLVKIGNSTALTIPSGVLELTGLEAGDMVNVELQGSKLIIDLADVRKPTATKEV